MDNIPIDSKKFETAATEFLINSEGEVKSVCYEDCLNENSVEYDDIEENEREYVIFSDSEEESDNIQCKLKTLYSRMAQCSLGELMSRDNRENTVDEPSTKQARLEESLGEEDNN